MRSTCCCTACVSVFAVFSTLAPALGQVSEPKPYSGHKVVRVLIRDERDLRTMLSLSPDTWSESAGIGPVDFRVPPGALPALRDSGIPFVVLIDDLQPRIDAERARIEQHNAIAQRSGDWFSEYKDLQQINDYLATLQAAAPERASLIDIGQSLEHRSTMGMTVVGTNGTRSRPAILLNACQHAREWISPMTDMYIADALTRRYGSDPRITRDLDRVRFIIVPVSNPDGFAYTWTPGHRLWRKNRRPNADGSFGVDLNRNWGYQWGGVGASPDPANDTYRGAAAWSEPEVANLRDLILANPDLRAHVDLHSYAQYILYPWAFTPTPAPDRALFASLGASIAQAIRGVHHIVYQPGQWYQRLYPSSGTMIDYAYAERDIISFTFELRDTGTYGFVLPPQQIVPTAEEILPAVLLLAESLYTPADWNGDGTVNSTDFYDFCADFFADNADFDGSGATDAGDFFAFLDAFLP